MCGIVGYVGRRDAYPILIKGLHRLEYRGYDSAGVALVPERALNVFKCKGKVADLERSSTERRSAHHRHRSHPLGHARRTKRRKCASPLLQSKTLALIHNGIIENYHVLKDSRATTDYTFRSDTDTEVLVN